MFNVFRSGNNLRWQLSNFLFDHWPFGFVEHVALSLVMFDNVWKNFKVSNNHGMVADTRCAFWVLHKGRIVSEGKVQHIILPGWLVVDLVQSKVQAEIDQSLLYFFLGCSWMNTDIFFFASSEDLFSSFKVYKSKHNIVIQYITNQRIIYEYIRNIWTLRCSQSISGQLKSPVKITWCSRILFMTFSNELRSWLICSICRCGM